MHIPFWTQHGTIDLSELRSADLSAPRIADTLAKLNRFSGRTREPWSVAAHSVLVGALCPLELKPWALLHDAHEAFIGDMTSPALELLCRLGTRTAVENAMANAKGFLDRKIGAAWNVAVRSQSLTLRQADHIAVVAEAWAFMGTRPELTEPYEREQLDEAMSLLTELGPVHDWRAAKDLWLGHVQHYASCGLMTPPATDPSDMSSADT